MATRLAMMSALVVRKYRSSDSGRLSLETTLVMQAAEDRRRGDSVAIRKPMPLESPMRSSSGGPSGTTLKILEHRARKNTDDGDAS